jgi:hypothetical protein
MTRRLDLQALLVDLIGEGGSVYFQPPSTLQMSYPCIVYQRDDILSRFADNSPYHSTTRYMVTVIERDPDSVIPGKVIQLPLCAFTRAFVADNLHHDVFDLYY